MTMVMKLFFRTNSSCTSVRVMTVVITARYHEVTVSVPEVSYCALLTPSVSCSGMKMLMKLSFGTSSSCTSVRVVTVAVRVDLLRMA